MRIGVLREKEKEDGNHPTGFLVFVLGFFSRSERYMRN